MKSPRCQFTGKMLKVVLNGFHFIGLTLLTYFGVKPLIIEMLQWRWIFQCVFWACRASPSRS